MADQTPAALAALGNRPSPDDLIARIAETVLDRAAHEHPERGEDPYCLNLTSWMGERMGGVLVRLRDAETERDALRERAVAAERALALRTCLVPGCLAQHDAIAAMTGEQPARPEWSAEGWLTVRSAAPVFPGGAHICPKHAEIVKAHLPLPASARGGHFRAVCACGGWASPPMRWHRAVRGLWEEHLLGALDAVADDGICGDCATGRCHGTTPGDCDCGRHNASTREAAQ